MMAGSTLMLELPPVELDSRGAAEVPVASLFSVAVEPTSSYVVVVPAEDKTVPVLTTVPVMARMLLVIKVG